MIERASPLGVHLLMPRLGEAIEPSRAERPEPWWRPLASLEKDGSSPTDASAAPTLEEGLDWPID